MVKKRSNALFYLCTIAGLLAVIFFVLRAGTHLEQKQTKEISAGTDNTVGLVAALHHPLAIFILQVMIVIAVARICSVIFQKTGQPAVMGEIVAGILLGPSLLGTVAPGVSAFLFPQASLGNLQMLSQTGLILFMFVIGMELDTDLLRKKAGPAVVISHASIIFPYGLGVGLSYFLYKSYVSPGVHFYSFALFMGIAMSITAFPVLARIIRERGLTHTRLGAIAIACAAADDVTAWCLLAIVIAVVKAGSVAGSLYVLLLSVVYVLLMFFVIKPLLKKILMRRFTDPVIRYSTPAFVFIIMLLSAWCCEVIGIHALFGAFLAGVIMPSQNDLRHRMISRIEDVALVLLLPLFFVFTGLRTQIGLLNDVSLWLVCLVIIAVAIAGKFGGSALAARYTGENLKDSLMIGALMNTRGLVELVVLNIGYDLGILSPQVFTMMVLMALVTTFMTTPLLNLINRMK